MEGTHGGNIPQSQEGDVLYEWLRFVPFSCCAGLDGDHCGDVGLYAGDAGAATEVSCNDVTSEECTILTVRRG